MHNNESTANPYQPHTAKADFFLNVKYIVVRLLFFFLLSVADFAALNTTKVLSQNSIYLIDLF